jgi:glucose-6-phosphate isomerase
MKLIEQYLKQPIDFASYQERVNSIHNQIKHRKGPGSDFLGWERQPLTYNREEIEKILEAATYIRTNFDILVVCGIGGSYLGARAVIEAINGIYSKDKLEIIYLGHTFSPTHTAQVIDYLKDKNFAINVISKSGTTTETSIAFRLLKTLLEKKLSKDKLKKAIYCTTDKEKGALRQLAVAEGYPIFDLPSDIGGRFSVLTPVGLLPIAGAGIDIKAILNGAAQATSDFDNPSLEHNIAYRYAVIRHALSKSKKVEMFVTYEPQFAQLSEWLKQLFGESEGKEGKGLLPTSASFSTDLHSLGQFIQDGTPLLFETLIYVKHPTLDINVPLTPSDLDELNYLAGRPLSFINEKAFLGTLDAHVSTGNVSNLIIELDKLDAYNLGYLLYFFMKTCAMSAYLLKVNPFNQPGVEVYKRNMFHLLGKKGF